MILPRRLPRLPIPLNVAIQSLQLVLLALSVWESWPRTEKKRKRERK